MPFASYINRTLALTLTMAACAIWSSSTSVKGIASAFDANIWGKALLQESPKSINIAPIFVWDGHEIYQHNLDALKRFRQENPQVSVLHFINPAYFARGREIAAQNRFMLQQVIKEGDRIGLHLSGWRSLTKLAGVVYRSGPTFWGTYTDSCSADCGSDVPLHLYNYADIKSMLAISTKLLRQQGLASPIAIRVNGFVSTPIIRNAAISYGIYMDFSATSPAVIRNKLAGYPLYHWVQNQWSLEANATPFALKAGGEVMTIVPDNLGAVDYHSPSEISDRFAAYSQSADKPNRTFALTMHQSTAHRQLPKLRDALAKIFSGVAKTGQNLSFLSLPGKTYGLSQVAVENEDAPTNTSKSLESEASVVGAGAPTDTTTDATAGTGKNATDDADSEAEERLEIHAH